MIPWHSPSQHQLDACMLIDLHNHTWPRSHDSVLDPKDLAIRAKDAGLDAISFTEHDALWPHDEVQKIAEETGIVIIPAVKSLPTRATSSPGAWRSTSSACTGVERLAEHVNERGGALVFAHPYRRQIAWKDNPDEWDIAVERAATTMRWNTSSLWKSSMDAAKNAKPILGRISPPPRG